MKKLILVLIAIMAVSISSAQINKKAIVKKQNYARKEFKVGQEKINLILKGNEPICELTTSLKKQLNSQGLKLNDKQYEQLGVHVWTTVNPEIDGFTIYGKIIKFKWSKVDILLPDGTKIKKRDIQICISLAGKCE